MPKTQLPVIALLLLLLGNASCFDTDTTLCATGIRCPVDQGCAVNAPVCITSPCGNGIIDLGEVCDDGDIDSGDGCSYDCLSLEICGNGITDTAKGEQCDDGGESPLCNTNCRFAFCGDGIVNLSSDEVCDASGESALCDTDCTLASCGDGLLNETSGELCDHTGESEQCNIDCSLSACGDGVFNATSGEQCDDGGDSLNCNADCTAPSCGDGYVNAVAGEQCDGQGETGDCDSDCTAVLCGDSHVNSSSEECDTLTDRNDCDRDCTRPICGDGYLNRVAGEVCDDQGDSPYCDHDCTRPLCGDELRNTELEQCDTGTETSTCDYDCTYATCNDGHVNMAAGEECDDKVIGYGGNGCTSNCRYSEGVTCTPSAEVGELWHLGTPKQPTNFKVSVESFYIFGNGMKPYRVPKPAGSRHLPVPIVDRYDPNEDHDYGWVITWEDQGSDIVFTVRTLHASDNTQTHIAGRLFVFGFDDDLSSFEGGNPSGYPGNFSATLRTRQMTTRTKAIPFAYTTSYETDGLNEIYWSMTETPGEECATTFGVNTNTPTAITWHANSLLLAEPIRAERRFFIVGNNSATSFSFDTHAASEKIWLPVIMTYDKAGDHDYAYSINCSQASDSLDCTVLAWDGGGSSHIFGYVLLLESLSGF
jgi:cysteine-rich repeat protein